MLQKFPKTFNQTITLGYKVDKPQSLKFRQKNNIYYLHLKKFRVIEHRICCLFLGHLTMCKTEEPPCKHSNMLMQYRNIPVCTVLILLKSRRMVLIQAFRNSTSPVAQVQDLPF